MRHAPATVTQAADGSGLVWLSPGKPPVRLPSPQAAMAYARFVSEQVADLIGGQPAMPDTTYRPQAVTTCVDVHVADPKAVDVRDRHVTPGVIIAFGGEANLYLTPAVEARLLDLLAERAPRLKGLRVLPGGLGSPRLVPVVGTVGDPPGAA
jgi:hypothetical protein